MANRELSSQGTVKYYGPRKTQEGLSNCLNGLVGVEEVVEIHFSFDDLDLPSLNADDDKAVVVIPAHSYIKSAYIEVATDFAGGTSVEFGFAETDGSVIDDVGIDTIIDATLVEGFFKADGALVDVDVGALPAQITISETGTHTAGRARLVVTYMRPFAG